MLVTRAFSSDEGISWFLHPHQLYWSSSFWWIGTLDSCPVPRCNRRRHCNFSTDGEIQLVWHLMVLSKGEATQPPPGVKAYHRDRGQSAMASIPAFEFDLDPACPCYVRHYASYLTCLQCNTTKIVGSTLLETLWYVWLNNLLGTGPVCASARTPDALPLVF